MGKSAIYASARLSALENRFLGRDRLKRMLEASGPEEALKVLYEAAYAGGMTVEGAYEYERLLEREEKLLNELMREISPKEKATDCFAIRNDYFNAKVLAKAKYGKAQGAERLLSSGGTLDAEALKAAMASESYAFLPPELAGALRRIDALAVTGALTPAAIDLALDEAYEEDLSRRLGGAGARVAEYFRTEADFNNLKTLVRLKRLGVPESDAAAYFMPGGAIAREEFAALYRMTDEQLVERFRYSGYREAVTLLLQSLSAFETYADNYLLNIFKPHRHDYFSIEPVIGYYLGKRLEMKNVRIVMTAQINSMDKSLAEQRLRDSYV